MTKNEKFQPTEMVVRYEMIAEAVRWVCNRIAFTVDRANMNLRSLSERLDDGIMGEIASVAVMQFLADKGRHVIAYDQIRKDEYKEPDPGWDVLTSRTSFADWLATTENLKIKPQSAYSFSIKSSRIPKADNDDINAAIKKRDFKIFKKKAAIGMDITADFEVQVYYLLGKSVYDRGLRVLDSDVFNHKIDEIIGKLQLQERFGHCYLSGAASRSVLISYSNSLEEQQRYWSSFHAGKEIDMWRAPLTLGTSLLSIV